MAEADPRVIQRWTRRPLFSPQQMLTAEQLNLLMEEQRGLTESLMRGLHGNGVVFGLAVTRGAGPDPLTVSCGMALDRHGRRLQWSGGPVRPTDLVAMPQCKGRYTLSIHYARREVPGGGCGPCADRPQWIEEGVVYSLRPECRPLDRSCVRPSDQSCIGLDEYVCQRNGSHAGALPAAVDLDGACEAPGSLCRIDCREILYDEQAGIPIACVEVVNLCDTPGCDPCWAFGEVGETCEVRPWVYRTPLLFELIKGCQNDLARVQSVLWGTIQSSGEGWPETVPWADLAAALRNGPEVTFTKPVRSATLHPGSVFLTAILWERQADYMLTRRVPATLQALDGDDQFATRFRLQVSNDWIRNEIDSRSELKSGGRMELTIRGQMIRDRCDNLLDAVPLGYAPSSPPQSRPGGDFVALLRFAAEREAPPEPPEPQPETPAQSADF